MSDKIYDVPAEWSTRAFVDDAKYNEMYARSTADSDGFWAELSHGGTARMAAHKNSARG